MLVRVDAWYFVDDIDEGSLRIINLSIIYDVLYLRHPFSSLLKNFKEYLNVYTILFLFIFTEVYWSRHPQIYTDNMMWRSLITVFNVKTRNYQAALM